MNKMTMKEANRNFSKLAKIVDDEGALVITKHGKERYVIMTKEVYDGKSEFEGRMIRAAEKGLWVDLSDQNRENPLPGGDDDNGKTLARISKADGRYSVLEIHFPEGSAEPDYAGEKSVPEKELSFIEGSPLIIRAGESSKVSYKSAYMDCPPEDATETRLQRDVKSALEEFEKRGEQPEAAVLEGPKLFVM